MVKKHETIINDNLQLLKMKFKAAILEKLNNPLIVDEIELNDSLGLGQVLVQIKAAGVCGAQIREITGSKGFDRYLPHFLGHEGAGIVVDIGPGVKWIKSGDTVVCHWRKGKGIESDIPQYRWGDKKVNGKSVSTFSEYSVVSENRLTPISGDYIPPFDVISLLGCAVTTGLGIINNDGKLKIGQSIAVIGVGGVGLNVVQGAAMVSAGNICAIDICINKMNRARLFGATETYSPEEMHKLPCYDIVVECTGLPEMIDRGLNIVSPGGKLILVGQPKKGENVLLSSMCEHYRGKTILDSQGGLTEPNKDIPRYINLYLRGKLMLKELITHKFSLGDINKAIDTVQNDDCGRCVIEM